jgi:hypothetical protein
MSKGRQAHAGVMLRSAGAQGAPGPTRAAGSSAPQSQYVDRTWTRPNITQAIAHGLSRHPLGRPGRSQGVVAPGQAGGQDGCVRAAGAVGGAVRVPLARNLDQLATIEEEIGRLLAVTAGENDVLRTERLDGPDELVRRLRLRCPNEGPRLRKVGRGHGRPR